MSRREKLFGPGRAVPLDRNAKARIMAYARAWGARHRQPGQTPRSDHPRLPGGPGGAAVGLPQQPQAGPDGEGHRTEQPTQQNNADHPVKTPQDYEGAAVSPATVV